MSVVENGQQIAATGAPESTSWDPRAELAGLTSLRGIAAIIVVIYHLEIVLSAKGANFVLGPFRGVVERGYLFVDFFFILSGLVIAHVYAQRSFGSAGAYGGFIWNRLARIYPLHLFATGLLFLRASANAGVVFVDDSFSAGSLISELLLLDSIGLHDSLTWNEVSWSVSAEWISYLLAPVILLLARPGKSSVKVAIVAIVATWVGLIAISEDRAIGHATFGLGAVRGVLGFTAGVALYRVQAHRAVVSLASKAAAVPLSVLAVFVILTVDVHDVLVMPAFLALTSASIHAPKFVSGRMDSKPLMYLGEISYSVYLMQTFAIFVFRFYLTSRPDEHWQTASAFSIWLPVLGCLGGLIVMSAVTYRRIERPAQAKLRSLVR